MGKIHKVMRLLATSFLFSLAIDSCAPKIQSGGILAPANMIIDGKITEWPGGKLYAYNPSCRLYYTICNDDSYLYLIVKGSGLSKSKVLYGGLNIVIVSDTSGKALKKISIAYPQFTEKTAKVIQSTLNSYSRQRFRIDSTARMKRFQLDSILGIANRIMIKAENKIKVTGIHGVSDSLLTLTSNKLNIKAASQFDSKSDIVCEIALPLNYVRQIVGAKNNFSYNLTLYGVEWVQGDMILIKSKPFRNPPGANSDIIWSRSASSMHGNYSMAK